MDITNYIQYIAFNKSAPPGKIKYLSFLKECRLLRVSLYRSGRLTEGYMWHCVGVSIRLLNGLVVAIRFVNAIPEV